MLTCSMASPVASWNANDMTWQWHYITWREMTWHDMTWHDMTWHHMTSHDMTWHHMTWHVITWHDMTWHDITWHDITWHDMTWHKHDMTWHKHDMTWHKHDMTWHDMTWHDMTWHDIAWHGMAWHGMACCTIFKTLTSPSQLVKTLFHDMKILFMTNALMSCHVMSCQLFVGICRNAVPDYDMTCQWYIVKWQACHGMTWPQTTKK